MNKQRECQPCTACCDGWVRMVIDGVDVYPGHPCQHSTGTGCAIYADRPVDPCDNFTCGWILPSSPLPEWLRPDKGRVMVLPDVRRWQDLPVDVAVPVGRRIPPRALNWLKAFAEAQLRPLIYLQQDAGEKTMRVDQNVAAHGPPAFQEEIAALLERGEALW